MMQFINKHGNDQYQIFLGIGNNNGMTPYTYLNGQNLQPNDDKNVKRGILIHCQ